MSKVYRSVTRRRFLATSFLSTGSVLLPLSYRSRAGSALQRLNIGVIGLGGQGASNLRAVASENIVAICDVDERFLRRAAARMPSAKRYQDFRKMLEQKDIEAVIISTPDHTHALPALMAIEQGRHVYCEKPLAHNIVEVRQITESARRHNVATQMGNGLHASEGIRRLVEWVRAGLVGPIDEVHCWSDRPCWPQGMPRPKDVDRVPSNLAWDLWLGPAPARPYNSAYHPFKWRGFWEFGTGALGDMGCHILDGPVWALNLGYPSAIEARSPGTNQETAPAWSIIRYEFNAPSPLTLTWYDGGKQPPAELLDGAKVSNGSLLVGRHGRILMEHGGKPKLIGADRDLDLPGQSLQRSPGHHHEWIQACKGGPAPGSNFNYAGPLTEIVLAGNVALRAGKRLVWNGPEMRAENAPEVAEFIGRAYRRGWDIATWQETHRA